MQWDQMARYFFNFWPFKTMKNFQKHKNVVTVGLKFCQILNEAFKNCQSGEISPNLITLLSGASRDQVVSKYSWENLMIGSSKIPQDASLFLYLHSSLFTDQPTCHFCRFVCESQCNQIWQNFDTLAKMNSLE